MYRTTVMGTSDFGVVRPDNKRLKNLKILLIDSTPAKPYYSLVNVIFLPNNY